MEIKIGERLGAKFDSACFFWSGMPLFFTGQRHIEAKSVVRTICRITMVIAGSYLRGGQAHSQWSLRIKQTTVSKSTLECLQGGQQKLNNKTLESIMPLTHTNT